MCGIVGTFNQEKAAGRIKTALNLLKSRGKDGFGISDGKEVYHGQKISKISKLKSKNLIGHTLHSIVGHQPQPIKKKGILVANCEVYNWKELAKRYQFGSKNDAELLLDLIDKFGLKKVDELDGVYAFAYWLGNKIYLARDILGEKPLWFVQSKKSFAFASEKKVLRELGSEFVQELNPRQILTYDLKSGKSNIGHRQFFETGSELTSGYQEIKKQTSLLLDSAMEKRIPKRKFGVLFSGGVDSLFIAFWLKQKGYDFTCYTAALETDGNQSSDQVYAQKIAEELGLKLKIRKVKVEEIDSYLKKVVPLIEDSNVVKATVALTIYLASELARKDRCKVIFSGLGSEEIFAGYERHKLSANLNSECLSGLLKMYERDLYRDDVITMNLGLELRTPFLDLSLIRYALRIPEKYKIKNGLGKWILREIILNLGLKEEYALRKKVAAQYGSKMDYALERSAKIHGFASKSAYLQKFYSDPNLNFGVLFSSGKDSTYAAYIMQRQNYRLGCLVAIQSENQESYMFHTPAIEMAKLQAKAMKLPLLMVKTKGEKEIELKDLERALSLAKKRYKIEGVVSGAIFSTYQRDRVERVCDKLGLKIFSPLWHKPQEMEMRELLAAGFEVIISAVASEGMDKSWLGRKVDKNLIVEMVNLHKKYGTNIAFEGGEAESLVLDCPLFKKKIELVEFDKVMDSDCSGRIVVKKARLVEK